MYVCVRVSSYKRVYVCRSLHVIACMRVAQVLFISGRVCVSLFSISACMCVDLSRERGVYICVSRERGGGAAKWQGRSQIGGEGVEVKIAFIISQKEVK